MSYKELNPQQKLVVDAYVGGAISMADAVIEAGYANNEGYTPHDVAERLLSSAKIQRAIAERSKILNDRSVASALWYVRNLVDYAQTDPTDIFDLHGRVQHPHDWPAPLRRMVRKIKMNPLGEVEEVSFEPKVKILELLGRTDIVGAFSGENAANETVVVIRDMTRPMEKQAALEVAALASHRDDPRD